MNSMWRTEGLATLVIVDTVKKFSSSRIYNKYSKHYGELLWTLQCESNKVQVLEKLLEDKDFLKKVENGSILNKKFEFSIIPRGKYIVRVKQIS